MDYADLEKWKIQQQLWFCIGASIGRLQEAAREECKRGLLFGNCIDSGYYPRCRACRAWEALRYNHCDIEEQPGLAAGFLYSAIISIDGKPFADRIVNHSGGNIQRLEYD